MSEKELIEKTPFPSTRTSLARDLSELGVHKGMVLLVHSSLRKIGWTSGGPVAVVQALMDAVTAEGTIVMPAHSGDYSNPEIWKNPPVPKEWVKTIKDSMPPFNPLYTPTRDMGRIVDCFRNFPGVVRSDHPQVSFAAWGMHKKMIVENHCLDFSLGTNSPLGRIYDLDGYVLLLGVSYVYNTSFHLAEYQLGIRKEITQEAPIMENGKRVWKVFKDIDYDESEFETVGSDFEKGGTVRKGSVGLAESRLFSQRTAVDFAVKWFEEKK
jgi:aminoglycoside 3-N-acetyltransferase